MLKLRQFDLELAFSRPRSLGKDVQNERGAIQDLAIEYLFQVAALRGRKFVVEDDCIDVGATAVIRELVRFALADKSSGVRRVEFLDPLPSDFGARGGGQLGQFLQGFSVAMAGAIAVPGFKLYSNKKDPFGLSVPRLYQCFQMAASESLSVTAVANTGK